jgi:hypothetical protein
MKNVSTASVALAMVGLVVSAPATAGLIDGASLGGTLRATQDTPTSFGDSVAGTQDSPFGGELDALYGDIVGGTLALSIAGNIEGNFNKAWVFIDTKDGGENTLDASNTDGGFNEIQNLAGMTFDAGFAPDWAIRIEVGSGFYSINFANLVANSAGNVWSGGGFEDLPASNRGGGFAITHGWDNSNAVGVTGASAAGALTATTGLEFSIDMATAFGDGSLTSLSVMAIYGNGSADFMSNQVLPGISGGLRGVADHLGDPEFVNFNNIGGLQYAVIPEPATLALLSFGSLALIRRRR